MASFDELFQRGVADLTGGNYQNAVADFNEVQALNPGDARIYANRGSAYFQLNDPTRALPDLDQAIRMGIQNSRLYFLRGRVYGQMRQRDQAIADYTEAIRLDPTNHQAWAHRGNLLNMFGQGEQGLPDLNKAVALQPNNTEYRNMRAMLRGSTRDDDGAIADLTFAIDSGRVSADNYFYRGLAHFGKKDVANAVRDYRQALQLDPNHSQAPAMRELLNQVEPLVKAAELNDKAAALNKSGDPDGALKLLAEAIALNPNDEVAYNNRARIYNKMKQYNEAIASASQAIALKPDFGDAYANRAVSRILLERGEEALPDLDKAISLGVKGLYGMRLDILTTTPPHLKALNTQAIELAQKNDLPAAREKFSEIIRQAPNYSGGYGNRGNVLLELKEYEAAVNDFSKAIELQHQHAYVLFGRGRAYMEQPNPDLAKADADFTAAIAVHPEMGTFYRFRAVTRLQAGRFADAIPDLEMYGQLGGWKSEKAFIEQAIALSRKALGQ